MTTEQNKTIITVGHVEADEFGNLWVTPAGGGDRIKIGAKRKQLHPIFQQGKVIQLHWETYMNKPYVSDAKQVTGESLPPPTKPKPMPSPPEISGPEIGLWWKQLGDDLRSGHIDRNSSVGKALRLTYFAQMFKVLNIDLKELQASETKTTPPSKPATAGTQPKTKGTGTVSTGEQGEGQV